MQNSSVVKAKLVFERIPIRVKELSDYVRSLRGMGTAIKCGDLLDVMWAKDGVLFMKEKGVFEYVLTAQDGNFSDLEWDGQCIWVSLPNPVRDIPIAKLYDDPYHNIKARRTDEKGLISFYVEPDSEARFKVYGYDDKRWRIVKTVTYKVGGRDSAGKEFILQY